MHMCVCMSVQKDNNTHEDAYTQKNKTHNNKYKSKHAQETRSVLGEGRAYSYRKCYGLAFANVCADASRMDVLE